MRKHTFYLTALTLFFGSAQQVSTVDPFGIPMNSTKQDLMKLGASVDPKTSLYIIKSPPTPNSAFEEYDIAMSDTYGLCYVFAIGKDINTDGYGGEVKDAFKSMRTALIQKYGTDRNFDFLHANSIWDEEKYWMRGLEQDERSLTSFWSKENLSSLPSNISEIVLSAEALSGTKGYLTLSYRSVNYKACVEDRKKASNSGL